MVVVASSPRTPAFVHLCSSTRFVCRRVCLPGRSVDERVQGADAGVERQRKRLNAQGVWRRWLWSLARWHNQGCIVGQNQSHRLVAIHQRIGADRVKAGCSAASAAAISTKGEGFAIVVCFVCLFLFLFLFLFFLFLFLFFLFLFLSLFLSFCFCFCSFVFVFVFFFAFF